MVGATVRYYYPMTTVTSSPEDDFPDYEAWHAAAMEQIKSDMLREADERARADYEAAKRRHERSQTGRFTVDEIRELEDFDLMRKIEPIHSVVTEVSDKLPNGASMGEIIAGGVRDNRERRIEQKLNQLQDTLAKLVVALVNHGVIDETDI